VKHSTDDGPVTLQVLNDLHTLKQLLPTLSQFLDFRNACIQHRNFLANKVVARILLFDGVGQVLTGENYQPPTYDQHAEPRDQKALLALFTQLFTPGQKVDLRSEERRVGKEGRSRESADREKK